MTSVNTNMAALIAQKNVNEQQGNGRSGYGQII